MTRPFKAFYFNLNLEHCLYDRRDIKGPDSKNDEAQRFRERYINDADGFYKLIAGLPAIPGDYRKSWDERELRKEAFGRLTNSRHYLSWITGVEK